MNIGGVGIGGDNPCRVVAEISNNHNGDLHRAIRLIDAVKAAGADLVKFQCYTPQELVDLRGDGPAPDPWGSDGWTMRDLYEKAQTPHHWFPALVEHCRRIGMPWFSSVFGPGSLQLLLFLDCPAYKIAALDADAWELWLKVRDSGKPLIVSLREPHDYDADLKLYCPEGYPQEHFDFDPLEHFDGLSYHGTDPAIPFAAAALGAKMLEVHVHLRDEPSELEANVSLDEHQLRELCEMVQELRA